MIAEQTDTKSQFLQTLKISNLLPKEWVDKALAKIETQDFPTSKEEYWKYTRPTKIINSAFTLNNKANFTLENAAEFDIPNLECIRIVLLNGCFNAELSNITTLPAGISIKPISATALACFESKIEIHETNSQHIFTQINTAYATGGVFITLAKNTVIDKTIHLINIHSVNDGIANMRNIVVAETSSSAKFIFSTRSTATTRTFTNTVNEWHIADNARVEFNKIQNEQEESLQLSSDFVYQEKNSYYSINTMCLNGSWLRNNLNIIIDGENCESRLYGLYPLSGHQHVDNHTLVDHRMPNSISSEWYKGILNDNSNAVFNGKVFVRRDAQKTNAFQQNSNILLSENAQINTKPELEIYADDVKCSHGCTTGQFDEDAVFYLRARGIGEAKARNLLIYAFAEDVLNNLTIPALKTYIESILASRFDWDNY